MRECALPRSAAPLATRTLLACIAAILEIDAETIPCAPEGSPWPRLSWWLATRNLAAVPVRDAGKFQWAGFWIARRGDAADAAAGDHVLMAGTPSGIVWEPGGPAAEDAAIAEGWVLAPPDPGRAAHRVGGSRHGTVAGIFRAAASDGAMESLASARLLAGVGLEGDRYALGLGRFSGPARLGQALTLIESEALDDLRARHGIDLAPGASRRNIVTRGIDLGALPGRRFRIGEVECLGQRPADPCSWLQRTTPPGTLRALVHRGGQRADILTSGSIRVGDSIRIDGEPAAAGPPSAARHD